MNFLFKILSNKAVPAGDIIAAQGDVNHLNLHQLLHLRYHESVFKHSDRQHEPHRVFLSRVFI